MTRYQLSIYAEKLPKGIIYKPNPYAIAKVTGGPRDGENIGTTEVIHSTQNPDFVKVFFIETDATINLPITITIYNDRDHTILAEATFEATEVYVAPGHVLSQKGTARGGTKIYVSIEESMKGTLSGSCTIQLRGLDIKNVEPGIFGLGRSDPFFELSRKNADHATGVVRWNAVYRSQYINNHLNPLWDEFTLSLEELCYGDINWPIKVTVYDYNHNGVHKEIGIFETSIYEMSQRIAIRGNADREVAYDLFKEDTNKNTARTRGLVVVLQTEIQFQENSIAAQQTSYMNTTAINNTPMTTKTTAVPKSYDNYDTTTTTTTSAPTNSIYQPDPPAMNLNSNWQTASSLQEV